jgi:hypothetical protein
MHSVDLNPCKGIFILFVFFPYKIWIFRFRHKKNTCGSGSRPTLFFLPTLLFFQRDWPCDPIFSRWLQAAHTACQNGVCCHINYWTKLPKFVHRKYASLVNIDVRTLLQIVQQKTAKTMKKIFKKKIISDLPTLIFSRYQGTN